MMIGWPPQVIGHLHAYPDAVRELQFLTVALHQAPGFEGVEASFDLIRPAGVSTAAWSLIESHFARLKLLERYAELSNDEIAEILSS
jgi:hypothetical protein